MFEVIVGNIGSVYLGKSMKKAKEHYLEYVSQSVSGYGRAGNEPVTLMNNDEPILEHYSPNDEDDEGEEF